MSGPVPPPFECGVCRTTVTECGSVGALDGKPVCYRCSIPLRPLMFALDAERAKVAELRAALERLLRWSPSAGVSVDVDDARAVLAKTGGDV